jgi:hypothetical protein
MFKRSGIIGSRPERATSGMHSSTEGMPLNYATTAPGDAMAQIRSGKVDLAVNDYALSPQELEQARLVQFPITAAASSLSSTFPASDRTSCVCPAPSIEGRGHSWRQSGSGVLMQ